MDKFTQLTAITAPLLRINVDTDAIIPSREMKRVSKEGLGEGLFASWRYIEPGSRNENPDFILNREPWRRAVDLHCMRFFLGQGNCTIPWHGRRNQACLP